MNYGNLDEQIIDYIDLVDKTLSASFIEKWKFKYSEKFIKLFQYKLLDAMQKNKPLKKKSLFIYLNKKCKYSPEQITNFFTSIEIENYYPLILS